MSVHELVPPTETISVATSPPTVRRCSGNGALYRLPELPYPASALEPFIPASALRAHHDVHHAGHVDGANRALAALQIARDSDDWSGINQLETDLAFHVSGHLLHSVMWRTMSPAGGGRPGGVLGSAIIGSFGSFEVMRRQFTRAAQGVQGSGWAALAWEPMSEQLAVVQIHDHHSGSIQAAQLLLVCDVWEHAYCLDDHHDRNRWLADFWELVDWREVSRRFDAFTHSATASLDAFIWPAFLRDIIDPPSERRW